MSGNIQAVAKGEGLTHSVHVAVDDVDVGTVDIAWWAGTPIRFAFGVVAREPGQRVDLMIEHVSYDPLIGRPKLAVFADHFDGKILDPERWKVKLGDGLRTDGSARLSTDGLWLEGRVLRARLSEHRLPAVRLLSRTMELASFKLSLKFRIIEVRSARVFLAVSNLLEDTGIWREYAAGVRDEPEGSGAFVAGQWDDSGQFASATVAQTEPDQEHELVLQWDAPSRMGTTWLDGQRVDSRKFDL